MTVLTQLRTKIWISCTDAARRVRDASDLFFDQ